MSRTRIFQEERTGGFARADEVEMASGVPQITVYISISQSNSPVHVMPSISRNDQEALTKARHVEVIKTS